MANSSGRRCGGACLQRGPRYRFVPISTAGGTNGFAVYYKKVRDAEATLTGEHFVMVSLDTSEGGKEGVRTEVPRSIAARLIAETRARVASEEETMGFHEKNRAAREQHEQEEVASRVQVVVVPSHKLKKQRERS